MSIRFALAIIDEYDLPLVLSPILSISWEKDIEYQLMTDFSVKITEEAITSITEKLKGWITEDMVLGLVDEISKEKEFENG
jgi:hypothetical protein